jgi:hypothetical protein
VVKALTPVPAPWQSLWDSFQLAMESDGKSPETLRVYRTSVAVFGQFMATGKHSAPSLDTIKKEVDKLASQGSILTRCVMASLMPGCARAAVKAT